MKTDRTTSRKRRMAVNTNAAPVPGAHYSQAINANRHILCFRLRTTHHTQITGDTNESQNQQTLKNIEPILKAGGASLKCGQGDGLFA
jgi:enamine deaminase RidA (YjgF/YER057c/UK114 family)